MQRYRAINLIFILFLLLQFTPSLAISSDQDDGEYDPIGDYRAVQKNFKGFSFLGILMGIPIADQMPACGGGHINKAISCYEGPVFYDDYYKIRDLPDLGFNYATNVYLIDGKVEEIMIAMHSDDAERMFSLIKKKYNKPLRYSPFISTNRMNAQFNSFVAEWKIKNCTINLQNRTVTIDNGFLIIKTKKYELKEKNEARDLEKKQLDSL